MTVSKIKNEAKPRLVKVPRAAKEIGIATSTARRLIKSGKIKAVTVGTRTFVPTTEIERIVAGGC